MVRRHRFKETAEPSMFDDIQTIRFASNDKIGKAFGVLNENLCLCLICDEVFTRQGLRNTLSKGVAHFLQLARRALPFL